MTWAEIRQLEPSERVAGLKAGFEATYAEAGSRILADPEQAEALYGAIREAYRATEGEPTLLRRAWALQAYAQTCPAVLHSGELLVGVQTFGPCGGPGWQPGWREELAALGWGTNPGHIVHDYEALLRRGVSGLRAALAVAAGSNGNEGHFLTLRACREALEAFGAFAMRWGEAAGALAEQLQGAEAAEWQARAETLVRLSEDPPESFAEALQLLWLTQIFLHAENPAVAISFGRIDQYLWPFLRADLAAGRTDLARALDLCCAFLLKCCEGEESQNAILGGVDAQGHEATNPLTLLFLQAMRKMRSFQPSLSVRLSARPDPELLAAACELATEGTGNPGFMNDPVVIAGLQAAGIPAERAWDWGVVGCYEAVPQGDCYGNTVLLGLHLPELLNRYLETARAREAGDFAEFLAGWWEAAEAAWREELARGEQVWAAIAELAPSPFGSLLLGGCLESGQALEQGGGRFNLAGVNLLGLGTLVDSLHAVREAVFRQGRLTVAELAAAVQSDFPDEALRLSLARLPGRYGTDSPETNALAREVSTRLARMVLASRLAPGVQPYPAFFRFAADVYATAEATPDGRHAGEPLSYGVGPATAVEASATAALRSAAHVAHELCACGNPFSLSLTGADLAGARGAEVVRELVLGYFALGGFHLHFNRLSPQELREAQQHPERYAHLTVRVSGYSARFVNVDKRWQDAIIQRAEQGR